MNLRVVLYVMLIFISYRSGFCKNKSAIDTALNKSGIYSTSNGSLTVSIRDGKLTGVYEYYDKWDDKIKEFRDINVFYIYGASTDNTHFSITTGWPGDENFIDGKITFQKNYNELNIVLLTEPDGYDSFDFTESSNENIFPLEKAINFAEVRIVKPQKAILYNLNDALFVPKKAYLVKGDLVSIIDYKLHYFEIQYHSPATDKISTYWIRENDLYSSDPHLWK